MRLPACAVACHIQKRGLERGRCWNARACMGARIGGFKKSLSPSLRLHQHTFPPPSSPSLTAPVLCISSNCMHASSTCSSVRPCSSSAVGKGRRSSPDSLTTCIDRRHMPGHIFLDLRRSLFPIERVPHLELPVQRRGQQTPGRSSEKVSPIDPLLHQDTYKDTRESTFQNACPSSSALTAHTAP